MNDVISTQSFFSIQIYSKNHTIILLQGAMLSLPFSRSMQSLSADRYRLARVGLILSILLVIAMMGWFFLAKLNIFEQSISLEYTQDNRLLAEFSAETIGLIRPGQPGVLRFTSQSEEQPSVLDVIVYGKDDASGKIEFTLAENASPIPLQPGKLDGIVSIQVGHVSPVRLVLQAIENTNQASSPAGGGSP